MIYARRWYVVVRPLQKQKKISTGHHVHISLWRATKQKCPHMIILCAGQPFYLSSCMIKAKVSENIINKLFSLPARTIFSYFFLLWARSGAQYLMHDRKSSIFSEIFEKLLLSSTYGNFPFFLRHKMIP